MMEAIEYAAWLILTIAAGGLIGFALGYIVVWIIRKIPPYQ